MNSKISRAANEPFWFFFPLGIIASILGVLMWPAFFHGWISYYPLDAHSRMMAVGFGGCFIAGFLGTAGPRLLGSKTWSIPEFLLLVVLALGMLVCLAMGQVVIADRIAGVWLLCIVGSLLVRVLWGSDDIAPPGVPLAALGLAGGGVASILLSFSAALGMGMEWMKFLELLLFQGLLWLPIMGVAPYLLPRFFGKESLHSFDESETIPEGWMRLFVESSLAGVLLLVSFALEAWGHAQAGMILRILVVTVHLARSVPGLVSFGKTNGLGLAVRWVLPCSIAGWALAVIFPALRIGTLHMMFIGGVGLLIIAVATRVFFGHGDRHDILSSRMIWFHLAWFALVFTAGTRLTSDFVPRLRITHFTYAAVSWIVIVLVWWWKVNRELKRAVPEGDEEG